MNIEQKYLDKTVHALGQLIGHENVQQNDRFGAWGERPDPPATVYLNVMPVEITNLSSLPTPDLFEISGEVEPHQPRQPERTTPPMNPPMPFDEGLAKVVRQLGALLDAG